MKSNAFQPVPAENVSSTKSDNALHAAETLILQTCSLVGCDVSYDKKSGLKKPLFFVRREGAPLRLRGSDAGSAFGEVTSDT